MLEKRFSTLYSAIKWKCVQYLTFQVYRAYLGVSNVPLVIHQLLVNTLCFDYGFLKGFETKLFEKKMVIEMSENSIFNLFELEDSRK